MVARTSLYEKICPASVRAGFWFHTALMFLVRSGRSTAALSLMVTISVSALVFLSALAVGVNDAMLRNTVGLFSGDVTGHDLPSSIRVEDLMCDGVDAVLKRVFVPGIMSNGILAQPVVLCAVDPEKEISLTAMNRKIVDGKYPRNRSEEKYRGNYSIKSIRSDDLLLSTTLASRLGINGYGSGDSVAGGSAGESTGGVSSSGEDSVTGVSSQGAGGESQGGGGAGSLRARSRGAGIGQNILFVYNRPAENGEKSSIQAAPECISKGVDADRVLSGSGGGDAASDRIKLGVSGLYSTGLDQLDGSIAIVPLSVIREEMHCWSAAIFLKKGVDPEKIVESLGKRFGNRFRFDSWRSTMPDLSQLIDLQYISMSIVMVLVFSVVAVGISGSFVIFIIRNMREYGVMKAMGVSQAEISLLIIIKITLMSINACCLGAISGAAISAAVVWVGGIDITAFTSHNRYFSVSGIIYPRLTLFSFLTPPVAAFIFSLAGSIWPASVLSGKKTADILRMI